MLHCIICAQTNEQTKTTNREQHDTHFTGLILIYCFVFDALWIWSLFRPLSKPFANIVQHLLHFPCVSCGVLVIDEADIAKNDHETTAWHRLPEWRGLCVETTQPVFSQPTNLLNNAHRKDHPYPGSEFRHSESRPCQYPLFTQLPFYIESKAWRASLLTRNGWQYDLV